MNRQILISGPLSEKNWREFYNMYYKSDRRFKLRFLYGTVTWMVGLLGLLGLFDNKPIAFGMIIFGLYCVFIKQYLINKAIKKLKSNPLFPGKIEYVIDQDQISGTDQGKNFAFSWNQLHGYREAAPGLLFYLKQATFFFIPEEALSSEEKQEIIDILRKNQVRDMASR